MENTIMVAQIKPEIIEAVKKSLTIKNRLQFELHISYVTLKRWLANNSKGLTNAATLKIIGEELNMSIEELLTD